MIGQGLAIGLQAEWRYNRLLALGTQPGITIRNMGCSTDNLDCSSVAMLEIGGLKDGPVTVLAGSYDIADLLKAMPEGQSANRTVLCRAREDIETYRRSLEEEQRQREEKIIATVKNAVKWLFHIPK